MLVETRRRAYDDAALGEPDRTAHHHPQSTEDETHDRSAADGRVPHRRRVVKLRELTKEETNPAIGLRVYVYSGGCSGFRYGMMLEDAPTPEDRILDASGIKVYVDGKSVDLLKGARDRLRRHADGRRLHGQQPERGRGLRLRLQLPDRRRRRAPPGSCAH